MANINGDRDLAYIFRLCSFSIRVKDIFQAYSATSVGKTLSRVFSTASPGIRSLTLSMNLGADSRFKFTIPPSFVDSLDCLVLDREFGVHGLEHLLQLFPILSGLGVSVVCCESIPTTSDLVDKHCLKSANRLLTPLSKSLRVLNACGKRHFASFAGLDRTTCFMRPLAPELNHYRGLFVGLVDRLPALRTLRVSALSLAQVNENILALVESSADPDCMAHHLRRLRVQPLCD
ncbi:hypothetical protein GGI06_000120 [Coemansia sp. S85]|nr:hypothetical protein GGI06_000120 [Coemansia sp. S85]